MMEEFVDVDWDEKKKRLVDLLEPLLVAYLYVTAVLSPILGLVLGIVAIKVCRLEKNKKVGKIMTIISICALGLWSLCIVAYIVIVVASMASGGLFSKM
jgi:hypothetical protein